MCCHLAMAKDYAPPAGKEIIIPPKFQDMDFTKFSSQFSYGRMVYTDDVAIFWDNMSGNGGLSGINIDALLKEFQRIYSYYRYELKFVKDTTKMDTFRVCLFVANDKKGRAVSYNEPHIGHIEMSANRLRTYLALAHEIGHMFQYQPVNDGIASSWDYNRNPAHELTSQWQKWQLYPESVKEKSGHDNCFEEHYFLRFMHKDNRYRMPIVLEYWSQTRGKTCIGEIYRNIDKNEDILMTYMRHYGVSLEELNMEMADCYSRFVTFDFPRISEPYKYLRGYIKTPVDKERLEGGVLSLTPKRKYVPEQYGFNIINLSKYKFKNKTRVTLERLCSLPNISYMMRLVTVQDGVPNYGPVVDASKKSLVLAPVKGVKTYLVVMPCRVGDYDPHFQELNYEMNYRVYLEEKKTATI